MGEEQRAAQRIDLPEPVPAKVGDVEARIMDVSLVGCRIEHAEKLAMGAPVSINFSWRGEKMELKGKVARTQLKSIDGKMMYSTGVQFATSVDSAPDVIQKIMKSLVKTSVATKPAAEVPVFFERAPFFREEDDEPPKPKPVAAPPTPPPKPKPAPLPPPVPRPAPPVVATAIGMADEMVDVGGPDFELDFNPGAAATHYDFDAEPAVASQSFELVGGPGIDLSIGDISDEEIALDASAAFELDDVAVAVARYIRCELEDGKWSVEQTSEAKQPREGFTIVDPGDQREIDQFCKTYEYADPDTRRMIRVSCELMIAQGRA